MKIFGVLFAITIIFRCTICFAQDTVKVNLTDTIHLSGYLKYPDGKPGEYIEIRSEKYPHIIRTLTDSTGFFKLEPALYEDNYSTSERLKFTNKGSRFLNLEVPYTIIQFKDIKATDRVNSKIKKDTLITLINSNQGIFYNISVFATFPGGFGNFKKVVLSKVEYPEKALNANIEGEVCVSFEINKTGHLTNIKVIRGIGYGCEQELVRVLKQSPKWSPKIEYGRLKTQQSYLNYTFKLND